MKTKLVYTVVSGKNDIYLPQALVAGFTARKYNPNASILLVVDGNTMQVIDDHLASIREYFTDIITVNVPLDFTQVEKSRYLKTTLRESVEGDFLYIDTDTVVTCDLSEIDTIPCDIAAALDLHSNVEQHYLKNQIAANVSMADLKMEDLRNKYFNGGVIFARDTPITHELFKKWHDGWKKTCKKGKPIDQPALARANMECGYPITELRGEWNCQIAGNFLNYLADAKILHYFASNNRSPYKLNDNEIFLRIWKDGNISETLKQQLGSPKKLFVDKHLIDFGRDLIFNISFVHIIFKYHYWFFCVFEYISRCIVTKRIF